MTRKKITRLSGRDLDAHSGSSLRINPRPGAWHVSAYVKQLSNKDSAGTSRPTTMRGTPTTVLQISFELPVCTQSLASCQAFTVRHLTSIQQKYGALRSLKAFISTVSGGRSTGPYRMSCTVKCHTHQTEVEWTTDLLVSPR
jgi:hypothetical protein